MRDFIQKRLHDNVGVVLFGDFAFTASPVTYEKEAIVQMVDYLQVGMAGENTAIGEGILMAVRALSFSKAKSKVIVLLTDGMQNSGSISPKDALKVALEKGIKIYTIGIGKKGEYETPLLKQIADQSGGKFFEASHIEALRSVYNAINQLERSAIDSDQIYAKVLWYPYFLLGALLLLIFSVIRQKGAV
jgi:Ca-activated chloride channel family protein